MPRNSVRHYKTIKHYFQKAHPEFNWTFTIAAKAEKYWGYSPKAAHTHQERIVEIALKNAKRDKVRGILVQIKPNPR